MNTFETKAHAKLPLVEKIRRKVKFYAAHRVNESVLIQCVEEADALKMQADLLGAGLSEREIAEYVRFTWAY